LKNDVLRLTSHGERQVGSEGHRAAREYLIDRMTELDMRPYRDDSYELPYGGSGTEFVNLIGRYTGEYKRSRSNPAWGPLRHVRTNPGC